MGAAHRVTGGGDRGDPSGPVEGSLAAEGRGEGVRRGTSRCRPCLGECGSEGEQRDGDRDGGKPKEVCVSFLLCFAGSDSGLVQRFHVAHGYVFNALASAQTYLFIPLTQAPLTSVTSDRSLL